MARRSRIESSNKVEIQMTPMLDMIFQLLVFFILTWKPVVDEGQFDLQMSAVAAGSVAEPLLNMDEPPEDRIPVSITLRSDDTGKLISVAVASTQLDNMENLGPSLIGMVGGNPDSYDFTIQGDDQLNYEYVMQAVSAVVGAGVRSVDFAPPQ